MLRKFLRFELECLELLGAELMRSELVSAVYKSIRYGDRFIWLGW